MVAKVIKDSRADIFCLTGTKLSTPPMNIVLELSIGRHFVYCANDSVGT